MISLGIIGPGLIWQHAHRGALAERSDRFRVSAVAGRSESSRERATAAYPDARVYADAQELIDDEALDAVVILTPISLNAPLARAALEAGRHAIVEKPVARSVAEARELQRIAARTGRRLYILEQQVHKPLISTLRSLIDEGRIGTPVSFERTQHIRIAEEQDQTGGFGSTAWRVHPDFPLGNFFDGGIHTVAVLQQLFGPARAVYARGRSLRETFGDYDLLSMVAEYPAEVHGTITHSTSLGRQGDSFVIHGTRAALVVTDGEIRRVDGLSAEVESTAVTGPNETGAMWDEVAQVITTGSEPRYPLPAALSDLGFMEAVSASLAQDRRVVIG